MLFIESVHIDGYYRSGSLFHERDGRPTTVGYYARDQAGNFETCNFNIYIKDVEPPSIEQCPNTLMFYPGNNKDTAFISWDKPVVIDNKDKGLEPTQVIGPPPASELGVNTYNVKYTVRDLAGNEGRECSFDIVIKHNGAMACDVWVGGRFCHPLCSQGYSVLKSLPNFMVCIEDGTWTNHEKLSDCHQTANSTRRYVTMAAEFYFTGNCNDPETQTEIKENFMAAVQNSRSYMVKKMCRSPECNIGNIKVICPQKQKKRSTDTMIINTEIYFESGNDTLTSQQYEAEVNTFTEFITSLETDLKSDNFTLTSDDQYANLLEMTSNELLLDCPANSVPVFNTFIACEGTFYDGSTNTCSTCSRGSYQPHSAQDDCIPCSYTQTTARIGAKDVFECEDACEPGTWSLTGIPPCVECDVGYYESDYGSTRNVFAVDSSASDNIKLTSDMLTINTNLSEAFGGLDLSTKWFHIALHISTNDSSLFVDGELHKLYESNVNFSQDVDLNITLGGDDFMGAISQFSIVFQQEYMNNEHRYSQCNSEGVSSGFVNWNEFVYSNLMNAYINIPSKCDDYDECQINPCVNGSCTDKLGGYTCACDIGFTGINCDMNIDDCTVHVCQNNATCIDEVNSYACSCDYGYTGGLCEITMVDGSWSDWDNWTECSVSCGNGTIQRWRACADPLPDNGGKMCEGSDTEIEICSLEPCRVCTELVEPGNSSLSCVNNSNTITCVLSCDEGFDFDHDVKEEYVCGNETYYYWDFQTSDNPYGRLPYCTEIVPSTKIHVNHTAYYDMERCDTSSTADVKNNITAIIESAALQLTCVTSNICTITSNEVINCDIPLKNLDTNSSVGFTVKLTCDTTTHGLETCVYGFGDAVTELKSLENGTELDFQQNSIIYKIVQNSSTSAISLNCPSGTVPVIAYCVPCSIGHFASNNECLSCNKGTYQDQDGQTFCMSCPKGMTTEGTDSVSIDDCCVPLPISDEDNTLSIILAVCTILASIEGFDFDTITLGVNSPSPVSDSSPPTTLEQDEAKIVSKFEGSEEDDNEQSIL
ncbi:unnamed protein product [Mytilus edulis]|uniref:Uncharacterized protein n=1 Tax=Mytilus edulis TaxID=6550 RepID=A0A8S3RB48_MYTED|nr:unnamed protein product [Mytilus edulis]